MSESPLDMIKKRLEEKEKKEKEGPGTKPDTKTEPKSIPKLPDIVVDEPKRGSFVKGRYGGRETISGSIPGGIKAAVDYIAANDDKYSGFGGKSKFIAEALAHKIKSDYPDVHKELLKKKE